MEFLDNIASNKSKVLQAARLLQATKAATTALVAEAEAWCSGNPPPVLSSAAFAPYPLRDPAKCVLTVSSLTPKYSSCMATLHGASFVIFYDSHLRHGDTTLNPKR